MIPGSAIDRLAASLDDTVYATTPVHADPLAFARAGADAFESAFFFSNPAGPAIGGLGTAWRVTASGPDRFDQLRSAIDDLDLPRPFRAMVGFSFTADGPSNPAWGSFAAAEAVVPLASIVPGDGGAVLAVFIPPGTEAGPVLARLATLTLPGEPSFPDLGDHSLESVPPVAEWRAAVGEAVAAIDSHTLDKVVLARSVIVRSDQAADSFDLLHHLEATYPRCFGFGWRNQQATFLGASPELLVRSVAGSFSSNPLAGSARRGEGEDEDRALAEALMRSAKDRLEHQLVVDDVVARLEPLADELVVPGGPSLKRMATVQHLSTPVHGVLADPSHVLELVAALHPTPAVGGTPRSGAMEFIEKMEGFDRGWYTGGIGWVDGAGDGEVAIALRCGLVDGARAQVFAGAGIVTGSDPEAELVETRLKLRPLLDLLAAT